MARLLVVDDEPDIRETIRDLLGFLAPDLEVVMATNGLEALDKIQRERIDAVLSDYRMPGMDGAELLEHLRKQHPRLPVAMFTAYIDSGTLKELNRRLPGLEIIPKPLDIDSFMARIRALLDAAATSPT